MTSLLARPVHVAATRQRRRLGRGATFAIVVMAALVVTAATHDIGYLLTSPLSGDESWVVIAKLFPLSDLPTLSSSAPVGFNLLVQAFGVLGLTGGRILVQLFAAGSIVAAFYLGRRSPVRPPRAGATLTGIVAAVTIAVTPATLIRVDVKHYSADAFVTLTIAFLMLRYVQTRSKATLAVLTVVSAVSLLIAFATLFAASAAFLALLVDALITRTGVRRALIAGATSAAGLALCYFLFSSHGDIPALRKFWAYEYPAGILALPHFVASRLIQIDTLAAFRTVFVIVPLVIVTIVVAIRRRAWAFALYLPTMFVIMCVLGLAQRYPLLEGRTSNFFVIAGSLFAGLGAFWLLGWAAERLSDAVGLRGRSWTRFTGLISGILVAAVLVGLAIPTFRAHPLPGYDTANQAEYVESHLKPHDLVLFNDLASYQLALTWKLDTPSWCPDDTAWTGYYICYPDSPRIKGFGSLAEAYRDIDEHLAKYPGSRVWLIRSNVFVAYEAMEKYLFANYYYAVIDLPYQPVGVVVAKR